MQPSRTMRLIFLNFLLLLASVPAKTQELYVFTEPASNMATRSIGLRLNNSFMDEKNSSRINYHLIPEVMLGLSKKVMLHADAFLSNRNKSLDAEGASVYIKYRFLSNDDVQRHFRMSAFARGSINNSDIHQEEINLYGHNSGIEAGVVATQLLHKIAISSGISFVRAGDNAKNKFPYSTNKSSAINYTLSAGKLMLPKEYKDYKQTNVNLILEFLNQLNLGSGHYYTDIAPALQFIFNSQGRIDLGYRKELGSSLQRTAPNGLFLRLEYNLFNVY